MAYICMAGGRRHQHITAAEGRACYQGQRPSSAAPIYRPPTPPAPVAAPPVAPVYPSSYVTPRPARRAVVADPRLDLIKGMVDMIPDGYYATQIEDGATVDFLRISRPNRRGGRFNGSLLVQTQHSEQWNNRLVLWPSGQWSVYDSRAIPLVLLVIGDHKTCAMRYSIELQRCQRCAKQLTDDRSRHYLIGPECEKSRPWAIEQVDDKNGGFTFEQMVAHGLETRVWQDKAFAR